MTRVGVIDVGTNSVRLLVADGFPPVEVLRDLVITRLGEGVDGARRLAPEAVARTLDAIEGYAARARSLGAQRIGIAATSAVRDAADRDAFLAAVRDRTGIDAEVLSGEHEARLGFAGATLAIDAPGPYLVIDVGGGSTELVRGTARAERWVSLDIGSVRLTERHVRGDPPVAAELAAVRAAAERALDDAVAAVGAEPPATLVGLAGTITTLAALVLGLDRYERPAIHHARLARADVARERARLAAMRSAERRILPVMPPGREDVIVAGVVILEAVMDRWAAAEVVVSESDILDGIAADRAR